MDELAIKIAGILASQMQNNPQNIQPLQTQYQPPSGYQLPIQLPPQYNQLPQYVQPMNINQLPQYVQPMNINQLHPQFGQSMNINQLPQYVQPMNINQLQQQIYILQQQLANMQNQYNKSDNLSLPESETESEPEEYAKIPKIYPEIVGNPFGGTSNKLEGQLKNLLMLKDKEINGSRLKDITEEYFNKLVGNMLGHCSKKMLYKLRKIPFICHIAEYCRRQELNDIETYAILLYYSGCTKRSRNNPLDEGILMNYVEENKEKIAEHLKYMPTFLRNNYKGMNEKSPTLNIMRNGISKSYPIATLKDNNFAEIWEHCFN